MWVIFESITVGLIVSLINKYIINKDIVETCLTVQEEEEEDDEDHEMVAVSTSITDVSGAACQHHHINY